MSEAYKYYQYGEWRDGVIIDDSYPGNTVRDAEREARKEYGEEYKYIKAIARSRKGVYAYGYLLVGTPK